MRNVLNAERSREQGLLSYQLQSFSPRQFHASIHLVMSTEQMKIPLENVLSEVGTIILNFLELMDIIKTLTNTCKFMEAITEFYSKILIERHNYPWIKVHIAKSDNCNDKGFYKNVLFLLKRKGAMIIGGSIDSRRCKFFSSETCRFRSMDYMSKKGDTSNSTAVWHKGRMFVFSCQTESVLGSLEIYNPVDASWLKDATGLPITLKSAAAASCHKKLYVLGGDHYCKPHWKKSDRIFYLSNEDSDNEQHYQWTEVSSKLSRGRIFHSVTSYNGKIWITGGIMEKRPGDVYKDLCTRSVEIFDPTNLTVTKGSEMLRTRLKSTPAVIKGILYVIGGDVHQSERTVGTVERYCEHLGLWVHVTEFPKRREGCAICAVDSTIYVFGGYEGRHNFNDWDAFNVDTNRWLSEDDTINTECTNPPHNRVIFPAGNCTSRSSMNVLCGAVAVATCPS